MVNAPVVSGTQTIELPRFGTCTFSENDVVVFPWGIPGFDEMRSFVTLQLETQDQIIWLQSLDDLSVAIPLGDPWAFFPDYDPKIPSFASLSLDLDKPEDCVILSVMVGTPGGPTFMNLFAPIIINLKTRTARQVPLDTTRYTVAMEIPVPKAVLDEQAGAQAEPASE
jgi:flagellar assembly factor FliW